MQRIIYLLAAALTIASCSSIDCPLNNTVATTYKLKGDVTKLSDTLTIVTPRIDGNDTVVLNRAVAVDSFIVPVSHSNREDVLYFKLTNTDRQTFTDTVRISKTNIPHFESVDCPPNFFHKIERIACTHHAIDSIVINNANVEYDASKAHFHIYFKKYLY